jgi:radical SAM superfamily enzyme YgiQ (UPF0313 family)
MSTRIEFVATRKNPDRSERELYEMDLLLRVFGFKRAFLDLGIQTVAACTPSGVDYRITDEYIQDIDYSVKADAVALSAKTSCVTHAYEVAREFRSRGTKVILGGIHASLRPDEALEHVDCVVTGEAEALWPSVVEDLKAGKLKSRYDAAGFPPMDKIPHPAWSASPYKQYLMHQLQTTRGCPFRCKFCSVPDISGQDFRFKPVENVIREIASIPMGGGPILKGRPMYIVDDNFISRSRYTKELLQAMVPVYRAGKIPSWSAETTLNVAMDEEMLDLFRDAGCATLIIGFESVSEATLKDMDKPVNFSLTYQEAVNRIHSRGITIVGNFIVGFDTDTLAVFKQTRDFIQETGIIYPFFSILTPMPGTNLHEEVKAEGRLDHFQWELYDTRHVVFEPKLMTREQLMDGYVWLYEQCYGPERLYDRLERLWTARAKPGSNFLERLFIGSRLKADARRSDDEHRRHYAEGVKLMKGVKNAEAGQLLFVLDGYDFARFLRRYNTARKAEHYAIFENPEPHLSSAEETASLLKMQWENHRAARNRTAPKKTAAGGLPLVQ